MLLEPAHACSRVKGERPAGPFGANRVLPPLSSGAERDEAGCWAVARRGRRGCPGAGARARARCAEAQRRVRGAQLDQGARLRGAHCTVELTRPVTERRPIIIDLVTAREIGGGNPMERSQTIAKTHSGSPGDAG